jgi:signal peptidase I
MKRALGLIILVALIVAVLAKALLLDWLQIAGADMAPTLESGASYLVLARGYTVERGAVVVLSAPGTGQPTVRRIVGLPGDRIEYRGQVVYVNGQPAQDAPEGRFTVAEGPLERALERYRETLPGMARGYAIARDPQRRSKDQPALAVPAGSYYVLADNRNHGRDSREYGVVAASALRGRVIRRAVSLVKYEPID